MARYIELAPQLVRLYRLNLDCKEVIKQFLLTAPTIEIVRCKDCKYHDDETPGMIYCPNVVGGWVSENFFCADGERKEDD